MDSATAGGFSTLLKNRPFLMLWLGQMASQIADKVFIVLLFFLQAAYQIPPEWENSARSGLLIANTLPAILLGSAAGIFVDRFDKRQVMVGSNFLRGVLLLLIPLLPQDFSVLLLVAFLESILTQFFAPAEQAAIPLLVPPAGLMTANALFTTTMLGSMIVGFASGDSMLTAVQGFGRWGQCLVVGGLYMLAAGFLQLIAFPKREESLHLVTAHPWHDLKAGLSYVRRNSLVSSAMIQLTVLYSVFAALMVLATPLVEELGLESTKFGYLLAFAGVGMVLGAAALGQVGDRLHGKPLPLLGFLMMAVALFLFTFINSIPVGFSLSLLLGIGGSLIGIPMQTLIQQQTPENMRGKVFGFQNNLINIALSLPLVIAGTLTDRLGLRLVLVSMSVVVVAIGVWAWENTRRSLRSV
jgi:MFS family permease